MRRLGVVPVVRAVVVLLALASAPVLAGCGDDDAAGGSGEDLYQSRCAVCHGPDGGGGVGADLTGVADRLTVEEHVEVVTEGRNQMPAFGNELSDEDIRSVVEYERTGLDG